MIRSIGQAAGGVDWTSVGAIGIVVLGIILTGVRRLWMFTWTHELIMRGKDAEIAILEADLARERTARQEWETIALTQAGVLERTVQTTTEIVRQATAGG